jgi:competence protein CoiA
MPLSARIAGKTVTGPDLSENEWAELASQHKKGLAIAMPCCGAPGHLRRSRRGTQHFYHATGAGCGYEEESPEHLELKHLIYRACKDAGWEAQTECPAPDRSWIADVLAEKDGRRIAFEIQISRISVEEIAERDRKYREEGIESYWLLDDYLGKSKDLAAQFDSWLRMNNPRPGERVPYLDESVFTTGSENHLFIAGGIRSAGLHAKKQEVFTTSNPAIPVAVFAREILAGNYRRYLEETAAAFVQLRTLRDRAAPALLRFREFYQAIVRDRTYRQRADRAYRIFRARKTPSKELQKKFDRIFAELDWLENEYRSYTSTGHGLFVWKELPGKNRPALTFTPAPEQKIRRLEDCVKTLGTWEGSFTDAMDGIEREIADGKIQ